MTDPVKVSELNRISPAPQHSVLLSTTGDENLLSRRTTVEELRGRAQDLQDVPDAEDTKGIIYDVDGYRLFSPVEVDDEDRAVINRPLSTVYEYDADLVESGPSFYLSIYEDDVEGYIFAGMVFTDDHPSGEQNLASFLASRGFSEGDVLNVEVNEGEADGGYAGVIDFLDEDYGYVEMTIRRDAPGAEIDVSETERDQIPAFSFFEGGQALVDFDNITGNLDASRLEGDIDLSNSTGVVSADQVASGGRALEDRTSEIGTVILTTRPAGAGAIELDGANISTADYPMLLGHFEPGNGGDGDDISSYFVKSRSFLYQPYDNARAFSCRVSPCGRFVAHVTEYGLFVVDSRTGDSVLSEFGYELDEYYGDVYFAVDPDRQGFFMCATRNGSLVFFGLGAVGEFYPIRLTVYADEGSDTSYEYEFDPDFEIPTRDRLSVESIFYERYGGYETVMRVSKPGSDSGGGFLTVSFLEGEEGDELAVDSYYEIGGDPNFDSEFSARDDESGKLVSIEVTSDQQAVDEMNLHVVGVQPDEYDQEENELVYQGSIEIPKGSRFGTRITPAAAGTGRFFVVGETGDSGVIHVTLVDVQGDDPDQWSIVYEADVTLDAGGSVYGVDFTRLDSGFFSGENRQEGVLAVSGESIALIDAADGSLISETDSIVSEGLIARFLGDRMLLTATAGNFDTLGEDDRMEVGALIGPDYDMSLPDMPSPGGGLAYKVVYE